MSESSKDAAQAPSSKVLPILYVVIVIAYGAWIWRHVSHDRDDATAADTAATMSTAISEEGLIALTQNAEALQRAAESFKSTCATCHGAEGQGLVGPNLTDAFFLHGARPAQIHRVIAQGVIEKGMPGWELSLGAEQVNALAAYVLTLQGRNVPGKPPQGEKADQR